MTLFDNIIDAQSCVRQPFVNKVLLVRSPLSVIEQINPPLEKLWLFDPTNYDTNDTDDYVYLRLFPNYSPEDDIIGEQGLVNTFGGSGVNPSRIRRGFNADIRQSDFFVYAIIERLIAISLTSSYVRHSPIKIIDFLRPDIFGINTTVNFAGEYGTISYGNLYITQPPHMIRGVDGRNYARSGWSFRFQQITLSSV